MWNAIIINARVGPFGQTGLFCAARHPGHKSHPRPLSTAAIYVIFLPLSRAPRNKLNQALWAGFVALRERDAATPLTAP
jgi:hypothetical protein